MSSASNLESQCRMTLPDLPLFAGLQESDRDRIAAIAHRRTILPGVRLSISACDARGIYLIRRGYLKATQDNEDGEEVILAIHGPGELLGDIGLTAGDEQTTRAASALAIGEVDLAVFRRDAFLACLATMPVLSLNLLALYADRLLRAGDRIESLATADVEERLVRLLHDLARAHGEPALGGRRLPYRITQVELASMVGASRVRVNQMLGELKSAGIVSIADGRIVVRERATG